MKKLILLTALLGIGYNTYAQEMNQDEAMQKWMEYATPSDMHKMLAKYNGEWEGNMKMWMAPGAEPMESTATITNDMHMGDRYQKSTYSGTSMGMPFQGESMTAYDNMKKKFYNTWIDNMGTGVIYSEGEWNADSKTVTYNGKMSEPMSGTQLDVRQVITYIDNDHYKMEMYYNMGGQDFKSMEANYTRK